jgi:hypothetical protein
MTLCLAALLRASQLGHFALPHADEWLGELLEVAEIDDNGLSEETQLQVWSAVVAVIFYLRPWHPRAAQVRDRVQRLLSRVPDPTLVLSAASAALVTDTTWGALDLGDATVALAQPLVSRPEASPSASAWFFYGAAYLRFVQARYEQSLSYFDAACRIASTSGLQETLSDVTMYRLMVEFRVCGWAVANATLQGSRRRATCATCSWRAAKPLRLFPKGTAILTALEPARVGVTDLRRDRRTASAPRAPALRRMRLFGRLLDALRPGPALSAGVTVRR